MKKFTDLIQESNVIKRLQLNEGFDQAFNIGKLKGEIDTLKDTLLALDIKSKYDKEPYKVINKQFDIIYKCLEEI